jgi:hypothetical protein
MRGRDAYVLLGIHPNPEPPSTLYVRQQDAPALVEHYRANRPIYLWKRGSDTWLAPHSPAPEAVRGRQVRAFEVVAVTGKFRKRVKIQLTRGGHRALIVGRQTSRKLWRAARSIRRGVPFWWEIDTLTRSVLIWQVDRMAPLA